MHLHLLLVSIDKDVTQHKIQQHFFYSIKSGTFHSLPKHTVTPFTTKRSLSSQCSICRHYIIIPPTLPYINNDSSQKPEKVDAKLTWQLVVHSGLLFCQ